jgi:hypothetical protein
MSPFVWEYPIPLEGGAAGEVELNPVFFTRTLRNCVMARVTLGEDDELPFFLSFSNFLPAIQPFNYIDQG